MCWEVKVNESYSEPESGWWGACSFSALSYILSVTAVIQSAAASTKLHLKSGLFKEEQNFCALPVFNQHCASWHPSWLQLSCSWLTTTVEHEGQKWRPEIINTEMSQSVWTHFTFGKVTLLPAGSSPQFVSTTMQKKPAGNQPSEASNLSHK